MALSVERENQTLKLQILKLQEELKASQDKCREYEERRRRECQPRICKYCGEDLNKNMFCKCDRDNYP